MKKLKSGKWVIEAHETWTKNRYRLMYNTGQRLLTSYHFTVEEAYQQLEHWRK